MSITCSVIINRARKTLFDPDSSYWTDAELLDYLNSAMSAIVQIKPDTYVVSTNVSLAAGVDQTLPSGGLIVLGAYYNGVSKKVVREVSRKHLDEADPSWPAATAQTDVSSFMFDVRRRDRFLVSPPNNGSGQLFMFYGARPGRVSNTTDNFPLPDEFEASAFAYVVAMAFGKNTTRSDTTKLSTWMSTFYQLLGASTQADAALAPTPRDKT